MRFQSFKIVTPDENDTEAATNTKFNKTMTMKEKISKKTKGLRDTARQLRGLSSLLMSPEKDQDDIPGPNYPLIELTLEPVDDLLELDTEREVTSFMNKNRGKQKIDTVEFTGKKSGKAIDNKGGRDKKKRATDIAPNIKFHDNEESGNFSRDEEEVNLPISPVDALPDVTAQELLNELEEIQELIRERQQN